MSFFTSPIPHQHQNNHHRQHHNHHYNGDEQHQFPERKVWDFPQVVEAKIEERSVDPDLGVIEISIMSSYHVSCHHIFSYLVIIPSYDDDDDDDYDDLPGCYPRCP